MSKDLPFFKFFPAAWMSGNITLEDFEVQGLFINICAYYWERDCHISLDHLNKKFQSHAGIEVLTKERLIKVSDGQVNIDFLDEQFDELASKKEKLSKAGKKGMQKRWKSPENRPDNNQVITSLQPPYNNKDKEEDKEEDIKAIYDFWNEQKIIVHKQMSEEIITAVKKSFKKSDVEEIKSAIENYKACLDGDYFFKYKWPLSTFLSRDGYKNPIKFLEGGEHYENFIKKAPKQVTEFAC